MTGYGRGYWETDDNEWAFDHHPTCPCGCGELADECTGPRPNPFGSARVETPAPNPYADQKGEPA